MKIDKKTEIKLAKIFNELELSDHSELELSKAYTAILMLIEELVTTN